MADIATGQTTASLWDAACRRYGDRRFLVHLDASGGRTEFSYAGFAAAVHRAAHAFRALGVGTGDTVALQLRNRPEMLTALFGLAEIGAIAVPLNLDATPAELLQAYQACSARWAVVEECRLEDHLRLRRDDGVAEGGLLVVRGSGPVDSTERPTGVPADSAVVPVHSGVLSYATLCAAQPDQPVTDAGVAGDTVAELLYTSGTTAAPKGVMITHANLVFSGHYGVWQASLRPDDKVFTTMPACHSNFQLAALTPVLVAGATLVMAERYSAHRFWQQVRDERAKIGRAHV